MHEIHSTGINGDVGRTERSDGGGRGIESDEMHIDIAVILESSGDTEAGGQRASETVDKHIDRLALILGEFTVNGATVEVITSDVAFERNVICGFSHSVCVNYTAKLPLYYNEVKDSLFRIND